MPARQPRGIRNHNPGNLRHTGDRWQGMPTHQPDMDFVSFKAPEWGVRALVRVLLRYQDYYGLETIEAIIRRWAPPSENDTESYITSVAAQTGFRRDEPLDLQEYRRMRALVEAIIRHENGMQPYDETILHKGLVLAGIAVPLPPVSESRTLKGARAAGAATIASGGSELLAKLSEAHQALAPLIPYLAVARWLLLAAILAGIGLVVYARLDDQQKRLT